MLMLCRVKNVQIFNILSMDTAEKGIFTQLLVLRYESFYFEIWIYILCKLLFINTNGLGCNPCAVHKLEL